MSDTSERSGTWAATVGGGALGATTGFTAIAALQAKRGAIGAISDKAHYVIDHMSTPEKTKAFAEKHFEKMIGEIEKLRTVVDAHLPEDLKGAAEEAQAAIKQAKEMKLSEVPESFWKEAHDYAKRLKPTLECMGMKKGLVASIPGGAATLTSAAALFGATIAYLTVSGIEKNASESHAR